MRIGISMTSSYMVKDVQEGVRWMIERTKVAAAAGLGYGEREFAAFGINPKHRPSRFEESLEIMRRLWAGETISHQGRWQLQEARISPTPPEKIEVWIAAQAEAAIERAARVWAMAGLLPPASPRRRPDLERYLDLLRQTPARSRYQSHSAGYLRGRKSMGSVNRKGTGDRKVN